MFAYAPADATAIPKPHHLLPHLNPDWFYLSGTGLPRLSWKRGGCSSSYVNFQSGDTNLGQSVGVDACNGETVGETGLDRSVGRHERSEVDQLVEGVAHLCLADQSQPA